MTLQRWIQAKDVTFLFAVFIGLIGWTLQEIYRHQILDDSLFYREKTINLPQDPAGSPSWQWSVEVENASQAKVAKRLVLYARLSKQAEPGLQGKASCEPAENSAFELSQFAHAQEVNHTEAEYREWTCPIDRLFPGQKVEFRIKFNRQPNTKIQFKVAPAYAKSGSFFSEDSVPNLDSYPRILPKPVLRSFVAEHIDALLVGVLVCAVFGAIALLRWTNPPGVAVPGGEAALVPVGAGVPDSSCSPTQGQDHRPGKA